LLKKGYLIFLLQPVQIAQLFEFLYERVNHLHSFEQFLAALVVASVFLVLNTVVLLLQKLNLFLQLLNIALAAPEFIDFLA
jgi:chromate transport protein ChrA